MGLFTLVVIILFEFTIGERIGNTAPIAGGIIWATLTLGAVLGVGRTWVPEREQRVLDAILIAPVSRLVLMTARTTALVIFLLGVQVVVVPLAIVFFVNGTSPVEPLTDRGGLRAGGHLHRDHGCAPVVDERLLAHAGAVLPVLLLAVSDPRRDHRGRCHGCRLERVAADGGVSWLLPVSGRLRSNLCARCLRHLRLHPR